MSLQFFKLGHKQFPSMQSNEKNIGNFLLESLFLALFLAWYFMKFYFVLCVFVSMSPALPNWFYLWRCYFLCCCIMLCLYYAGHDFQIFSFFSTYWRSEPVCTYFQTQNTQNFWIHNQISARKIHIRVQKFLQGDCCFLNVYTKT